MDLQTLLVIIGIITPILVGYVWKTEQRFRNLENAITLRLTDFQVRQLLADQITPLKEGLDEIKDKTDKIYDLIIMNGKTR